MDVFFIVFNSWYDRKMPLSDRATMGREGNLGRTILFQDNHRRRLKRCRYRPSRANFLFARPAHHAAAEVAARLRAS
ncbi:hypothetical protein, partial [uncultured Kushneria sp.]|uniref:hypothetical protein n=1 Tax=uncultured Kushneria sp. TaxID=905033 RepID=UPI002624CC04